MRKSTVHSVLALATFVLLSTNGYAGDTEREFCLEATSTLTDVTHHLTLSFTGLKNGHVLLYGSSCYDLLPFTSDCVPTEGTALLFENKLEISVHGSETQTDLGVDVFLSGNTHFWIDNLTQLTGTWASESITYIEGGPQGLQEFNKGTVKAVACPAVTEAEKQEDNEFANIIRALDKK
jgi:hypothetical protein